MKILYVTLYLFSAIVCVGLSYLVYPTMYVTAWQVSTHAVIAFVTNETTRQWTAIGLLAISIVLTLIGARHLNTPSPRVTEPRS